MFKIKQTNTILYCRNWKATVRFYRDILNFKITHETDWFVEFLVFENACLSIANADRSSIKSVNGKGITLSWKVKDIDKVRKHLQASGIETSPIKKLWSFHVFYFFDPEGHRIELWS